MLVVKPCVRAVSVEDVFSLARQLSYLLSQVELLPAHLTVLELRALNVHVKALILQNWEIPSDCLLIQ